MKNGTLFIDSHGGLWETCSGDANGAEAFGPDGLAREVVLTGPGPEKYAKHHGLLGGLGHGLTAERNGFLSIDHSTEWPIVTLAPGVGVRGAPDAYSTIIFDDDDLW